MVDTSVQVLESGCLGVETRRWGREWPRHVGRRWSKCMGGGRNTWLGGRGWAGWSRRVAGGLKGKKG